MLSETSGVVLTVGDFYVLHYCIIVISFVVSPALFFSPLLSSFSGYLALLKLFTNQRELVSNPTSKTHKDFGLRTSDTGRIPLSLD